MKPTTRSNDECDAIRGIGGNNVEDRVIEDESEQVAQSPWVINAIRGMSNVDHVKGPWGEDNYTHNNYTPKCMERDPTINDRDLADLAINDRDLADLDRDDCDVVDLDRDLREQEQASDTTINDECILAGGSVKMKSEDSMYCHESG